MTDPDVKHFPPKQSKKSSNRTKLTMNCIKANAKCAKSFPQSQNSESPAIANNC